ncbi:shikimate dehydrogenase family protein [Streptomyces chattanoogensis]
MASLNGGRRAELVAVAAAPDDLGPGRVRGACRTPEGPTGLEIRADLVGDPDPYRLRRHVSGPLTYTLRSCRHGGRYQGGAVARRARLLRAAAHYDLVDLEWPEDLVPELTAGIPPRQRRISWHGAEGDRLGLRTRFAAMAAVPAALYLMVLDRPADGESASAPELLAHLGRSDVTAFETGQGGTWTRILAPWLGAPTAFGRIGGPGDDGTPGLRQLVEDYGLPALPRLTDLYGIAGGSVALSLSPRVHNAVLREYGLPARYLPFATDSLAGLLRSTAALGRASGLRLRGLTLKPPHKEDGVALADVVSPQARAVRAATALFHRNGRWQADTTDLAGALHTLQRSGVDPAGQRVAVLGCGPAGRAAGLALHRAGASVTMVNRGPERGRQAAALTGLPYVPWTEFAVRGHQLLVHATPLTDRAPFRPADADPGTVVLELVYRDSPTALAAAARARGLRVIDGREVLLTQVREQFRLLTGRHMPLGTAQAALAGGEPRTDIDVADEDISVEDISVGDISVGDDFQESEAS